MHIRATFSLRRAFRPSSTQSLSDDAEAPLQSGGTQGQAAARSAL